MKYKNLKLRVKDMHSKINDIENNFTSYKLYFELLSLKELQNAMIEYFEDYCDSKLELIDGKIKMIRRR
jgi:Fe-S cluster assembly iron-binding protein IscA